jgi:peptide/nickel transport system substrate-binding protein
MGDIRTFRERAALSRWSAVLAIGALVLAACGGDNDDADDADGTPPTSAPVATTAPMATPTAAATTAPMATSTAGTSTGSSLVDGDDEQPVSGGDATYLFQGEHGGTFDPMKLVAASATIAPGNIGYLLYGMLVALNPSTTEVEPMMLDSITSSADGSEWTLHVRPDLVFSDGTPFDAEAIKVNWERHADPANASGGRAVAATMTSIEVVDPLTLKVTLSAPNPHFPRALSRSPVGYIAAPSAIEAGTLGEKPVGAGPFVLGEWVRDDHMTFVRNPNYWDAPRPYLDSLTIRPITDASQRINSLISGQGEVAFAYARDAGRAVDEGMDVETIRMNGGWIVMFNFDSPLGSDIRLRRALRLAIDNVKIGEAIDGGADDDDATTFFAPSSPLYDASLTAPAPDLDEAQQLIDEIANELGGPVEISILSGVPQQLIADAVQAQLSELDNLEVTVDVQASGAFIESVMVQKNFTVAIWNIFNLDPEPGTFEFFTSGSPRNLTNGYSNLELDAALQAGRATTDVEDRKAAYATMQEIINEELPVLLLKRSDHYILSNPDSIHGLTFVEDGITRWEQVWMG